MIQFLDKGPKKFDGNKYGDCATFKDFEEGRAYAKANNKPILLDFTCRIRL